MVSWRTLMQERAIQPALVGLLGLGVSALDAVVGHDAELDLAPGVMGTLDPRPGRARVSTRACHELDVDGVSAQVGLSRQLTNVDVNARSTLEAVSEPTLAPIGTDKLTSAIAPRLQGIDSPEEVRRLQIGADDAPGLPKARPPVAPPAPIAPLLKAQFVLLLAPPTAPLELKRMVRSYSS
jgi:hypothetical protein